MDLRFSDSKGFNYLSFLGELQPSQQLEDKYLTRMGQLTAKKQQVSTSAHAPIDDLCLSNYNSPTNLYTEFAETLQHHKAQSSEQFIYGRHYKKESVKYSI